MPSPKRNLLFSIMVPILAKRRHWFMPLHQRMLSFLALGSNTERQGGKEMLSLVTSAGCCFCHSGQRASNHSKKSIFFLLSDLLFQIPDWVCITNKPPTAGTYTGSWHEVGTRTTQLQARSSPRELTNRTVKLRWQRSYNARGRQQQQTVCP